MKTGVIGAGGIGSHLMHMLANMAVEGDLITVIDGDEFEDRNLGRQLFDRRMVGDNKAFVMERMYRDVASIEGVDEMVTHKEDLDCGFDFVFCVPDNNQCRRIALQASTEYGFKLIIAGNEATSANAIFYDPHMVRTDSVLHPLKIHPEYAKDTPPGNSCSQNIDAAPQTIVANNIAASMCMALYAAHVDCELPDDVYLKCMPIEYEWGKTFFKKHTSSSRLEFLTSQKK